MSVYREFTGKSVEDALRAAREEFGVSLNDLDFEILTPGSRGVLGMGAEPARIVAAPRTELGGAAPKREAAAARPLPAPPAHEDGRRDDRGAPGREDRGREERPRDAREDRGREDRPRDGREDRPRDAREDRPRAGRGRRDRGPRRDEGRPAAALSEREVAELATARSSVAAERADLEAAEASPEALDAGKLILEELLNHLGLDAHVEVVAGPTSRLNVVADGEAKDALGALIGRKGERLSALQHLVNLMLSRRMGGWTRVLVDVEDYRGRRERQLRDLALRAAGRVAETGKMLQLEPMPALERRWVHIALRDNADVLTQSVGEEPNRRIVVLPRTI
jgi:spoIIIJ-associated protein